MKNTRNIIHQKYNNKVFSSLEKVFSQHISKDDIVAVAVSGGPDSMFLSCSLYNFFINQKYNIKNLIFIHLNHGVRSESIEEAKAIKQRFKWTSLEIITRPKTSKATENDLRKRRYQTFLDTMTKYWANKIFLGHHFDDRVETSLLNLLRWCWVDGFIGIKPMESHHLLNGKIAIRPLLSIRKTEILNLCETQNIPYVQDKTNQDSSVSQRNYIRNEILPKLFLQKWFEQLFQKRYQKYDSQSIESLLQPITISPYRKTKSAYCLIKNRKECSAQDLLRIFKQLHASSGITSKTLQEFLPFVQTASKWRKAIQGVIVIIAHGKVYFFVASDRFREKTLDKDAKITTIGKGKRYPQKDDYHRWKTRNKYCITEKIPVFRRNFIPVLAKGNKIISWDKKGRDESTIY